MLSLMKSEVKEMTDIHLYIWSLAAKTAVIAGAFVLPIRDLLIGVGFMVAADTIFGICRAVKQQIPIQSKEFKRVISKTLLYQGTILVSFVMDKLFIPGNFIVKVSAAAIALNEAKSIFENLRILTGIDVWALLISKLQGQYNAGKNPENKPTSTDSSEDSSESK